MARTFDEEFALLAECGLKLAPPFTVDKVLANDKKSGRDIADLDTVLTALVQFGEDPPYQRQSNNVWYFDTEAIEASGDYVRIAKEMSALTEGSLELTNIQDFVDLEEGVAWLSFEWRGGSVRWDLEVEGDWVDSSLFGKFVALLAEADPSKIYIYYDFGGQACMLGCVTREQFKKLEQHLEGVKPLS